MSNATLSHGDWTAVRESAEWSAASSIRGRAEAHPDPALLCLLEINKKMGPGILTSLPNGQKCS